MEALLFLRMRPRRRLVAGALVAVALLVVGLGVALGRSAAPSSGEAWTRVLLDTPRSQLVESAPDGSTTLPWRASLLAHLMSTDSARRALARRLGVRPDEVAVVDPPLAVPEFPASMPQRDADAAAATVAPYVLTVSLPDALLPIISIAAAAPGRGGARQLADAAVAVLRAQASPGGRYRSAILTDPAEPQKRQPFVVDQAAPVHVKRVVNGGPPVKAAAAFLLVLVTGGLGAVLLPRVVRRRKIAAAWPVE